MNRRSTIHRCIALLGVTAAAALSACQGPAAATQPGEYRTLAKDPQRDTDLAERENARAVELISQGKLDDAESHLKKALTADIMFGPAHNNLGKVYYQQSKLYLAAWEFEYAIKLMANRPEPRNNLGLVFEAAGKLDDAVVSYQNAVDLEPDNPQFLGNLARARIRRGDKDEKVRDLLTQLVMKDTRPDWVAWAKQKLALLGGATTRSLP
jgi:Flp pilus assembly protein TadD